MYILSGKLTLCVLEHSPNSTLRALLHIPLMEHTLLDIPPYLTISWLLPLHLETKTPPVIRTQNYKEWLHDACYGHTGSSHCPGLAGQANYTQAAQCLCSLKALLHRPLLTPEDFLDFSFLWSLFYSASPWSVFLILIGVCVLLRLYTHLEPSHLHLWWQLHPYSGSACHLSLNTWTINWACPKWDQSPFPKACSSSWFYLAWPVM